MELPFRETFYPLGYAVEIITNDLDVLKAACESFGHRCLNHESTALCIRVGVIESPSSRCPPEPTRREYNHLYSLVADAYNQALLDLKTCTCFAWISTPAVKDRLYFRYNFLEKMVYLLLGASVVTDIHAACISKYGKGVLLCGDSGAGKSTLAYACARAGWIYTSDDTCYLINNAPGARVIGHSHRVRFRPAAKDLFPELAPYGITRRMEGKPSIEIPISVLPVFSTANEADIYSVIYLNRLAAVSARLLPLPDGTATHRMKKELFSAGEIRTKHEKMLEAFTDVPVYELQYTDLDDAIQQLDAFITTIV